MISAYITCKDEKQAVKISRHLLKKRLIACSNIFPIKSMYWWNKKIVDDNEIVILAKTIDKNFEKIKKEVKKIHSYEIPCILKFNIESGKEYEGWVKKETR
ncbi:divalent-cation tolerance protein CutA [Candidatus Woesearchaeota archaeon]|nr:divalent-cation tolerance protein CutA [Candidatus Woesearchaeota archaeon]